MVGSYPLWPPCWLLSESQACTLRPALSAEVSAWAVGAEDPRGRGPAWLIWFREFLNLGCAEAAKDPLCLHGLKTPLSLFSRPFIRVYPKSRGLIL